MRGQATALSLIQSQDDGVLLWQVACEYLASSRKLESQGCSSTRPTPLQVGLFPDAAVVQEALVPPRQAPEGAKKVRNSNQGLLELTGESH